MTNCLPLLKKKTDDTQASLLASRLPSGIAWLSKLDPNSNIYKFLLALAKEFNLFETKVNNLVCELDPTTTEDLIENWEKEVGIPDGCIDVASNLQDRRDNVLLKIRGLNVQTAQDFIDLAASYGFTIQIQPAAVHLFPLIFPHYFFGSAKEARFTVFVDFQSEVNPSVFPLAFPYQFGFSQTKIIECLFQKLMPATVNVIYRYIL